jgi:hypothetical protein
VHRVTELEYLVPHRTKTGGFEYELVYDLAGDGAALRFPGLADIEALTHAYDVGRSGSEAARSGSGRGLVGPRSVGGREGKSPGEPHPTGVDEPLPDANPKTHCSPPPRKSRSYPQAATPLAA